MVLPKLGTEKQYAGWLLIWRRVFRFGRPTIWCHVSRRWSPALPIPFLLKEPPYDHQRDARPASIPRWWASRAKG